MERALWTIKVRGHTAHRTADDRSDEGRITMQTPETIEIGGAAETRTGGSCIVSGFTCTDPRPVSHRRSAFFAALARRSGETADRIVAVELGWRIPSAEVSLEAQQ